MPDEISTLQYIYVKMSEYTYLTEDENRVAKINTSQYCKIVAYNEIHTLNQIEALKANAMAIKVFALYYAEGRGDDRKTILRYYYTSQSGVSCYNLGMSYGSLIFTTAHTHSYSYEEVCITCGAKE